MTDQRSNNAESIYSYIDPLDDNVIDTTIQNASIIVPTTLAKNNKSNTSNTSNTAQKKEENKVKISKKIVTAIIFTLLCAIIIILAITYFTSSSTFISKYENINSSNFTNKDQYVDPNVDNYNINYLVEQMIYKEFSPTDKKKYLDLPKVVKEKYIQDYLIQKI